MKTLAINKFIDKVNNCRRSGVVEFKISIKEATDIVFELTQLLSSENHLITVDDIKEILNNRRSETSIISGGNFKKT